MAPANYTAKDITVLEGLEPVRKRPGMYIGGVSSAGLHHLIWEILDNSVDEAMNGYAANIWVTLHADSSSITIEDDGRGIPIDKHPATKKSALEVIFTMLHAGGKFEPGNYKTAGGLHGVGASVVNALSKELIATVKRDGALWEMRFKQGQPAGPLKKLGAARGTGTKVYFHPDAAIFPKIEFDPAIIRERLEVASYLHKGVKVVFEDETEKQKHVFEHAEGIAEYLKKNRPTVEKFVKVTQRAFAECVKQSKPCVQALIDANGALSFDNELVNWQLVEVLMSDKISQSVALGWHDDARMKADYELVRDYIGIDKPFDVKSTYTNAFLDKSIKMKAVSAD